MTTTRPSFLPLIGDMILVLLAFLASAALVGGEQELSRWAILAPVVALVALGSFLWRGIHRIAPGKMGVFDVLNIYGSLAVVFLTLVVAVRLSGVDLRIRGVVGVPLLTALLASVGVIGVRVVQGFRTIPGLDSRESVESKRVLIVGAGEGGELIFTELRRSPEFSTVGFVDDDASKQGKQILGVPVLGPIERIPELVDQYGVEEIVIAIPSAGGELNRRIYHLCSQTKARVRNLPSIAMLVFAEKPLAPLLREFELEDLLRRKPVRADNSPAQSVVGGERVLITGGGGSIGGELARQVAKLGPAHLVLLGKGENSVFELDRELRDTGTFQSTPVVCDVRDRQALDLAFRTHQPRVVFHAAAHKHVPLMEAVPIEAVRNNIFGTLNAAQTAVSHGVKKFILVSTDKAVNPGNVMGATKRVAEMIVQAMAGRSETGFAIVRFGNVLGSRGSLVPILRRQIAHGGPVTVTHPEMTRYFMTIPEAAALIVQASAFGDEGQVFVLDMGEPVSILELAQDVIRMHGLEPGKDIEIKITGPRPGEKMHEELWYSGERLEESPDPRIFKVQAGGLPWDVLKPALDELDALCAAGDPERVKVALMELAWGRSLPPVGLE